jgi:hypothetical protein
LGVNQIIKPNQTINFKHESILNNKSFADLPHKSNCFDQTNFLHRRCLDIAVQTPGSTMTLEVKSMLNGSTKKGRKGFY